MVQINSEFAENPEPRCACLLLLDTSGSMNEPVGGTRPIDALNAGLKSFEHDIKKDDLAKMRVEIAIVTFGDRGVVRVQDFGTADDFAAPTLAANGLTPMGAAIQLGLDMLRDRKKQYRDARLRTYRPWVLLITDGAPTDKGQGWEEAVARVQREQQEKHFLFNAIGVAGADTTTLATITPNVLALDGLRFSELFRWLSDSLKFDTKNAPAQQDLVGAQLPISGVSFGSKVR